jgi:hypothetical protein
MIQAELGWASARAIAACRRDGRFVSMTGDAKNLAIVLRR